MKIIRIIKFINNKFYQHRHAVFCLIFSTSIIFSIYNLLKFNQEQKINDIVLKNTLLLKQDLEKEIIRNIRLVEKISIRWQEDHGASYNLWLLAAGQIVSLNPAIMGIQLVDANYIVRWMQPVSSNAWGLSIDLSDDKAISKELDIAKNSNKTIVSNVVNLISGGKGILSISPIYQKNIFVGFIIGIYDFDAVLKRVLYDDVIHDYFISIYENTNTIYNSNNILKKETLNYKLQNELHIFVLGKKLHLKIIPTKKLTQKISASFSEVFLLVGLLFSLLISGLIFYLNLFKISKSHLEILKNISKILSEDVEYNILLRNSIEYLSKSLDWDIGHVYLVDFNKETNSINKLISSNIWYLKNKNKLGELRRWLSKEIINTNNKIYIKILQNSNPNWINSKKNIFSSEVNNININIKSILSIPVKHDKKTAIILMFYNQSIKRYDDATINIINMLSKELSLAYSQRQVKNLWKKLALKDSVTHFMNFKEFYLQVKESLFLSKIYNYKIAVITFNIDNFKKINDNFGYDIGNKVLQVISTYIINIVNNQGYVARCTGKKFSVLMPEVKSEHDVLFLIKEIKIFLAKPIQVGPYCLELKIKVGYKISNYNDDVDKMIKYSDPLLKSFS